MGPECQALPCLRRCRWWVPAVRGVNRFFFARTHFLACEDVAGGSQQSGGRIVFFARTHFLACEDEAGGSQQSGGNVFFHEIQWPVRWVPGVRWRNHYFSRNKEALPCCGRGPSCQPRHVQSTSDGSRSLTMLTTPRREHQGGGRRQGLGRGRRGDGEDVAVDAHAERSKRVHWFNCDVKLPSPQGLASGGRSRGR